MDDLTPPEAPASGLRAQMLEALRDATLGEYEILMELGSGGMATVYLAHDLQLDRQVALKLLHPTLVQGHDMVERFILEARTAAKLSHANIVPIHAVKVQDDLIYFVMKFIEGRPLDSIIREQGPLDVDMTRHIVMQMADALAYAHRHGVIHRDVKPANILISTDGHPVLADFGIAKVADAPGLTMTGATIGTPTYMSPEQCDAQPLTGASDQYSLGVTAYEMLTGKPPFEAPSYMGILMKHMTESAQPVHEAMPSCPVDIAHVVDRMLAKQPADRFPDLEQVVEALTPATAGKQHKVRTQLVQFALSDPNRQRISRLSIPVSPIPTGSRRTRTTGAAEPRRSSSLGVGVLVIAAMMGGAVLVSRPWERLAKAPAPTADSAAFNTQPAPAVAAPQPAAPASGATDSAPVPPRNEPAPSRAAPARPNVSTTADRPGPAPVSSMRVSSPDAMTSGAEAVATAELRSAQGEFLAGRHVEWSSSDPAVLAVGPQGQLVARDAGRAVLTARSEGVTHAVVIVVNPEPVVTVAITPAMLALAPGASAQLTAHVTAASGREVERAIAWSSSAPAVATVSAGGRVTAVAPGSATITGAGGGKSGSSVVTVSAPAAAAPNEAEVREQVAALFSAYGRALARGDIARMRELYPGLPAKRAQEVQETVARWKDSDVRLEVKQVQLRGDAADVHVTGTWSFSEKGQRNTLAVDDRYLLERRGSGWIIVNTR